MDKALLKEREAFKKRALAQPSVEKRKKHRERDENDERAAKKPKSAPKSTSSSSMYIVDRQTLSGLVGRVSMLRARG